MSLAPYRSHNGVADASITDANSVHMDPPSPRLAAFDFIRLCTDALETQSNRSEAVQSSVVSPSAALHRDGVASLATPVKKPHGSEEYPAPGWRSWDKDSVDFVISLSLGGTPFEEMDDIKALHDIGFSGQDCAEIYHEEMWWLPEYSRQRDLEESARLQSQQASSTTNNAHASSSKPDKTEPARINSAAPQAAPVDQAVKRKAAEEPEELVFPKKQKVKMQKNIGVGHYIIDQTINLQAANSGPETFEDGQTTVDTPSSYPMPQYQHASTPQHAEYPDPSALSSPQAPAWSPITAAPDSPVKPTTWQDVQTNVSDYNSSADSASTSTIISGSSRHTMNWKAEDDKILRTAVNRYLSTHPQKNSKRPFIDWEEVSKSFDNAPRPRTAKMCKNRWGRIRHGDKILKGEGTKRVTWSVRDDLNLRDFKAIGKSYEQIAKIMGRSLDAVKRRWSNLHAGQDSMNEADSEQKDAIDEAGGAIAGMGGDGDVLAPSVTGAPTPDSGGIQFVWAPTMTSAAIEDEKYMTKTPQSVKQRRFVSFDEILGRSRK